MIRAILACDDNWGIGRDGDLPWPHNPADLRWFRESTGTDVVVMGRTTWESLPKRPLPNRINVVVSSGKVEGADHVFTPENMLTQIVALNHVHNIWIIGGAQLLNSTLDIVDEVHLSRIDGVYDCDTFLDRDAITADFTIGNMQVDEQLTIEQWIRT